METAKVFKEVNGKLVKLCESQSPLDLAPNNKPEMLKMMDFCLTLMEAKDRKFHDSLLEVKTEVATLKHQCRDVSEVKQNFKGKHKYQENELNSKMENLTENEMHQQTYMDMMADMALLKKALSEQKEEMKQLRSEHKTRIREFEVQIEKFRKSEALLQKQVKRLETKMHGNKCAEKMLSVDSKMSKLEKEFAEKMPELNEMLIKTKIFQIERNKLFPLPQVNSAGVQREFLSEPPDFVWKIPEMKEKLDQKFGVYLSDEFTLTGYQLRAKFQLTKKDRHTFEIKLILGNANKPMVIFNLDFFPRIFIVLKDHSGNVEGQDIIRTTFKPFNSKNSDTLNYYTVSFKSSEISAPLYNVNNSISLSLYVESPTQTRHVISYDGTLFWTIDDYWNRKQMIKKKLLFCHLSPYFYTSLRGYRVQAHIYLNGFDKFTNKGLSVGISFQNGEWDSELDLSFRHKTTVTVFNPSDPTKRVTKSVEHKDVKQLFYTVDMGSHEVIEGLLDHDVLFYKITTVKILDA